MKLSLHIGLEKTGSTSIQRMLLSNRDELRRRSVWVPASIVGWDQHARLYTFAKDEGYIDDFLIYCGLTDQSERTKAINGWKADFLKEARHTECGSCIISSELLQSRITTTAEIESLKLILQSIFDQIRIIIYLRDPLRLTLSFISTALRSGFSLEKLPIPGDELFHKMGLEIKLNHRRTINFWKSAFPEAELSVRIFETDFLFSGCVVSDFLAQCEISAEGLVLPPTTNSSLGTGAASILSALNKVYPRINAESLYNYHRDKLLEIIDKEMKGGSPMLPTEEIYLAYQAAYLESNEWVRKTYFPHKETLFRSYGGPFSEGNNFTLENTDLDLIARLLMRLTLRIHELESNAMAH
jgi:hypothetical protein